MKTDFHWKPGLVQSKVISLFIIAPTLLALLIPVSAFATDYPPTVPNPNVFGGDTDAPRVDEPTGAFTQRMQLDIPPGRNGLQPDLAFQYNSQNTTDSIVGYGWSLSIPYIERLNKTGSENLYGNTPYFTSSIDGELASEATTTVPNASPTILDNGSILRAATYTTPPVAISKKVNTIQPNGSFIEKRPPFVSSTSTPPTTSSPSEGASIDDSQSSASSSPADQSTQ